MSARKIRNTWWTDFRFAGKRYRKPSPENSRAGASAYEAVLRQKLARGQTLKDPTETPIASGKTFADFSGEWMKIYVRSNNKPGVQAHKESVLRTGLVPYFGAMRLSDISTLTVEQYKASALQRGLAPKSVNNHLTVLSKALKSAAEWEMLDRLPKILPLPVAPQEFDFLTREETQRLLCAITEPLMYSMVFTAVRTGMRIGELLALEWGDIAFERRLIGVRRSLTAGVICSPKSNRERHIYMSTDLLEHLRGRARQDGLVFNENGRYVRYGRIKHELATSCLAAGIRPIGWHKLRHTFASHLVMGGVPIPVVQKFLGHSDIRMTMRYSHLEPATLSNAIEVLTTPPNDKFGHHMVNTFIAAPNVENRALTNSRSL